MTPSLICTLKSKPLTNTAANLVYTAVYLYKIVIYSHSLVRQFAPKVLFLPAKYLFWSDSTLPPCDLTWLIEGDKVKWWNIFLKISTYLPLLITKEITWKIQNISTERARNTLQNPWTFKWKWRNWVHCGNSQCPIFGINLSQNATDHNDSPRKFKNNQDMLSE